MPHPNNLKVMGAKKHQYNALTSDQKERFNREAQRRLNDLQQNNMDEYIRLTESPNEEPVDLIKDNEEGRFF